MGGKLITSGQAADALGISRQTLSEWVRAGLVTPDSYTAGGHSRWDLEQLREQVRAHRESRGTASE